MSENILTRIYGTLLSPVETFDELKTQEHSPIFESFWIVILVSVIGALQGTHTTSIFLIGLNLFSYVALAVVSWLFFAGIFDGLTSIFTRSSKFEVLLTLTAYSLVPWILLGPVMLFKGAGILGTAIGIIGGLLIWIWSTVLFVLAVSKTYNLDVGAILLLIAMPFFGGIIAFFWIVGFISNLIELVFT